MLSKINKHELDKNIEFFDVTPSGENHVYEVKKKRGYTSVTTFIHSLFYPFNPNYVIDKMMKSPNWTESEYYNMTKDEIKSQWKKNGNEAAIAGTKMHADIEKYYNKEPFENDSVEFSYFMDFEKINPYKPYRTEWCIYDEELKFSGSIDIVYTDTEDNLVLGDWKRCKKIEKQNKWNKFSKNKLIKTVPDLNFWHYSLQLNLYKYIIEKNYNKTVSKMFLICLHPENFNQSFLKYDVPDMSTKIELLVNQRKQLLK